MSPKGRMWMLTLLALSAVLVTPATAGAVFTFQVDAGDSARVDTPVCAAIELPPDLAAKPPGELRATVSIVTAVAGPPPSGPQEGQVDALGGGKARLWWLVRSLPKGRQATYRVEILPAAQALTANPIAFKFQDEKGHHLDLLFGDRKVTRLMVEFNPDPKKRFATAKPFTHVFDAKGERTITSPGGQPYPHHRGIFLGYKVGVGGKRYDFWHVRNVWQRLEKFQSQEAGPVFGRMTAVILWEIAKDKVVVREERTITVYRQSKPEVLLDFVSTLHSLSGELDLGGDPEHAGCQFRPHPAVAKRGKETRYVHPPGMRPGNRGTKDMPWSTVSYALGESRFNVAHLNHPGNPKGTIYSAYRPYGRFGAFAKTKLPADTPLTLRYRIFVREGQQALTVEDAQRLYADFAAPPKVTLKKVE